MILKTLAFPPSAGRLADRLLYPLLWLTLAVFTLLYIVRPIRDPDFWWHLKSGEVMLQQCGLHQSDPFNYTGTGVVAAFQAVLLNGYWLWETVAALLYRCLGFPGILIVKFVTLLLMAGAVLSEMVRQRLSHFTMLMLATVSALVIVNVYHLERPQIFSFFFMTLLLGMLAQLRLGGRPNPLLFPLMVLWANIHRGFVIGDILLLLAAAGFLFQYCRDPKMLRSTLVWAAGGILLSFVNPNGWHTFIELGNFMQNSIGPVSVSEYQSSWQLFARQSKMTALLLWSIAALHLGGLILARRRFWPEIFVSLFIICFGVAYIRNIGFIAVSLLPMTGWYLEQAYSSSKGKISTFVMAGVAALFLGVVVWLSLGEWQWRKITQGPIYNCFPVHMGEFLKKSGLSGHLFNEYNTGGYLNWALYPQWKTFIDGRELYTDVSSQYLRIAAGADEVVAGKPYYEYMLDHYQVDVVALGLAAPDGRLQPLLKLLLGRPEWIPVFLDNQSFVLARYTPQNASAIHLHGVDKKRFRQILTRVIANHAKGAPDSCFISKLYADALLFADNAQGGEGSQGKL